VAATVRIDDLTSPVLSDAQRGVLEYVETLDLVLEPAELLQEATALSGLATPDVEGGDPTFAGRLAAYLAAIEADTGLTGLGRMIQRTRVIRLLSSRMLLHDLLARHPEIHDIEIAAPFIVVGLPRSGTTHLVNLLAADPRRRALPYWESQEPFPRRGDGPGPDGVDPRHTRARQEHESTLQLAPLTQNMHDRFPEAIEEECEVMDLDFCSYTLEWHARVPTWRDHYLTLDQDRHYAYLRMILQALTFLRGPRSWVLKCPQHLENLGPLMRTFPDATVAFTHRDPVAVLQSAITMLAYGDRMRRHEIAPAELRDYWVDRIERLLRGLVRDRDLVPADQSIDVLFHEFMADDMAVVDHLYDVAGVELPARVRDRLSGYLEANPRGKHGQVRYDLEGDFGVSPAEVRARFDFYTDRWPVLPEA
jgi:hypothetical protein